MKPLFAALLLVSCFVLPSPVEADTDHFGGPLTLFEKTPVSEIEKNPGAYVGKKVLIEGTVVEVCAKRGCWMDIASDTPFSKFQVKVKDGVIVFPMSARGRTARVEGVVEKIKLSRKQALAYHRHQAEEKGRNFDPSAVTGPETIYRLKALGAEIFD